jgi:hypothetical protein
VVQPDLVLWLGEAVLHGPAATATATSSARRHAGRGVAREERQLPLALVVHHQGPPHEQATAWAGGQRPVIHPASAVAVARGRVNAGADVRERAMSWVEGVYLGRGVRAGQGLAG